jgi:hypothetical protein
MAAGELSDAAQSALLASPLLRDLCLGDASAALLAALASAAPSLGLQTGTALRDLAPLLPPAAVQPAPPLGDDPLHAAFGIFKRPAPLRSAALPPLVAAWRVADFLGLPVATAVEEELVRRFAWAPCAAAAAPEWRQARDAEGGHALFERAAARYAAYRAAWVKPRVLRCGVGPRLRLLSTVFHVRRTGGWREHRPPPAFVLDWAPEDDAAFCDTWWGVWRFQDEAASVALHDEATAALAGVTLAVGHDALICGGGFAQWRRLDVSVRVVAAGAVGAAVGRRMDVLTELRATLAARAGGDGAVPRGCTVAQLVAAVESRWAAGVEYLLAEVALPAEQHARLAAAARAVAARAATARTPPPRQWVPDADSFDYDQDAVPFGRANPEPFDTAAVDALAEP